MSLASRGKARETAAYLKKMGVERTTGQCPWGCGAPIKVGGPALLGHLTRCRGNPRKDGRARRGSGNHYSNVGSHPVHS